MLVASFPTSTIFLEKIGSSRSSPIKMGTFFFSSGNLTVMKKVLVPSKTTNSPVSLLILSSLDNKEVQADAEDFLVNVVDVGNFCADE